MTKAEWQPDINITTEIAKAAIESEFPQFSPIQLIKIIGEGWDNKVFLVNGKTVFRFPQREKGFQLIEQENRVLGYLNSNLQTELTIPNPHFVSKNTEYYFQGYPLVKGISAYQAALSEKQRISSAASLAKFLKQLHTITAEDLKNIGIKPQIFDRSETQRLIDMLNQRVKKIVEKRILDIDLQWLAKQLDIAKSIKLPQEASRLIHGDLYCRHLLFDQGKISGIIDWGDTGINHPAIDLSVVFSFYPKSCHPAFFATYGEVEEAALQYAHFIALYILLTLALYAHETKESRLLAEAAHSFKKLQME